MTRSSPSQLGDVLPLGVAEGPIPSGQAPGRPRGSPSVLRDRILAHGAQTLGEREILEHLLIGCGCGNPGEAALGLLNRFGCLARVLGAGAPELGQVVGEGVAVEIRLWHELCRRMLEFPVLKRCVLSSYSAVSAYLRLSLGGQARESFRVLYLDKANQLIIDAQLGVGTVDHAPVYPREVMRCALEVNASACCLVHNHPTGSAQPSGADIDMTRRVVEAGRALGIAVHDHFLVAGDQVVSFRHLGLI